MAQVPAARNTLRILALLSRIDVPVSAARIRAELDLPRSSTYHLLREMEAAGFVMHIPGEQTYGLGVAAYEMAQAYTTQQPLVRLGQKRLRELAVQAGGSGHLSRLVGPEIVYLVEVRSPGAQALITDVGVRLPALRTASGLAMLSVLNDAQVKAVLASLPDIPSGPAPVPAPSLAGGADAAAPGPDHDTDHATTPASGDFAASTDTTRPTLRRLLAELDAIRTRGFALEREAVARGQESVSVPVRDHLSRPAAAITVTHPVDSLDEAGRAGLVRSLREASAALGAAVFGAR
ncbi:IclR family transcriptional regulator [Corynebacterium frankenforstense]|uniref:IclR family transcriptional regulator n=1 Tax=Corynebacterium TaxID=1716 RepID=UPI00254A9286|nr:MULTISPECIES: IclR family transcriptional regulator [Corynebacterium]MDK6259608.1 IclR family transcriptional regulator [Corynebacterium frankenforstense]MDK8894806.1 IclR family transcriptional regulator [Corynebacterium sp. MSK006]